MTRFYVYVEFQYQHTTHNINYSSKTELALSNVYLNTKLFVSSQSTLPSHYQPVNINFNRLLLFPFLFVSHVGHQKIGFPYFIDEEAAERHHLEIMPIFPGVPEAAEVGVADTTADQEGLMLTETTRTGHHTMTGHGTTTGHQIRGHRK